MIPKRQFCDRRKGKGCEPEAEDLDWSDVFDPYSTRLDSRFAEMTASGISVFSSQTIKGCYVLKNALSAEEQNILFHACWFDYPNPPASTNLTAHYGVLPELAASAEKDLFLNTAASNEAEVDERWSGLASAGPSAASLFQKLRWVSLGPHYDWTARMYDTTKTHRPLPEPLVEIWQKFSSLTASNDAQSYHTQDGIPNVALVNYYTEGDTLGGHKDDAEGDLSKSIIVCVSLGQPAIFLMGGEVKETKPIPMILRSGDVIVLRDQARGCFHGIPRVLKQAVLLNTAYLDRLHVHNTLLRLKILTGRVSISIRSMQ